MIQLDLQSRIPIYEQLKNKIFEMIALDVLHPNDQLPSVRNLARDLGLNPNTIQKSYQELEREGVIYSVNGKGSFVASGEEVNRRFQGKTMHKLGTVLQEVKMVGVEKDKVHTMVDRIYQGERKEEAAQ